VEAGWPAAAAGSAEHRGRELSHALGYLEAIIRYVASAAEGISFEDVQKTIEQTMPEGGLLMGTIAQEWMLLGEQRGLQQGLLSGIKVGLKLKYGPAGAVLRTCAKIHSTLLATRAQAPPLRCRRSGGYNKRAMAGCRKRAALCAIPAWMSGGNGCGMRAAAGPTKT